MEVMSIAAGGADMPLYEFEEELSASRGESWLFDEAIEPGRRSSVMACAIRSRLPNADISSSLSRLASSSRSRSPVISCSVISFCPTRVKGQLTSELLTNGIVESFCNCPANDLVNRPGRSGFLGNGCIPFQRWSGG